MQETILISETMHRLALDKARNETSPRGPPGAMAAPISSFEQLRFEELWDLLEGGLMAAARGAKDMAKAGFDDVVAGLSALAAVAGAKVEQVRLMILERLNRYLADLVDACLALVRPSILVAGKTINLKSVAMAQTLQLSGSLEASLTKIAEFVAEGQLSLTVQYEA